MKNNLATFSAQKSPEWEETKTWVITWPNVYRHVITPPKCIITWSSKIPDLYFSEINENGARFASKSLEDAKIRCEAIVAIVNNDIKQLDTLFHQFTEEEKEYILYKC